MVGHFSTPITPQSGSFFHADSHSDRYANYRPIPAEKACARNGDSTPNTGHKFSSGSFVNEIECRQSDRRGPVVAISGSSRLVGRFQSDPEIFGIPTQKPAN